MNEEHSMSSLLKPKPKTEKNTMTDDTTILTGEHIENPERGSDVHGSSTVTMFHDDLASIINPSDMEQLKQHQRQLYLKMKDAREQMTELNDEMTQQDAVRSKDLQRHMQMLREMKQDLEFITRKIRHIKAKCAEREKCKKDNA